MRVRAYVCVCMCVFSKKMNCWLWVRTGAVFPPNLMGSGFVPPIYATQTFLMFLHKDDQVFQSLHNYIPPFTGCVNYRRFHSVFYVSKGLFQENSYVVDQTEK